MEIHKCPHSEQWCQCTGTACEKNYFMEKKEDKPDFCDDAIDAGTTEGRLLAMRQTYEIELKWRDGIISDLKVQASNYAYQMDLAKRERDIAESQLAKAKELLQRSLTVMGEYELEDGALDDEIEEYELRDYDLDDEIESFLKD